MCRVLSHLRKYVISFIMDLYKLLKLDHSNLPTMFFYNNIYLSYFSDSRILGDKTQSTLSLSSFFRVNKNILLIILYSLRIIPVHLVVTRGYI